MRLIGLALAACCARPALAQVPLRIDGFGFGAAVVTQRGVEPSAQLAASALLQLHGVAVEAGIGSSVAELKADQGAQHDVFLGAVIQQPITRYVIVGGGAALHSLSTRLAGADTDPAVHEYEHSRSGKRGALVATGALQLPLAARQAAALQLTARASFMKAMRQFSFGLNVALRPGRGTLGLGEHIAPMPEIAEVGRSWESVVAEVMLLQGQLAPVGDVVATRNGLLITFTSTDEASLRDAIAHIARILNGSSEAMSITISAPDPTPLAVAATSGGFPPERITLTTATNGVTLQAIRPRGARSLHSARP